MRKMRQRFSLKKLIFSAALCCLCMSVTRAYAAEDSGIFADATAKVHTAMSEESDIVANLIVGSVFEVMDAQLDEDGNIWYQVKTDFGVDGYVKSEELERVIVENPQDNGNIDNNADNNGTDNNGADNSDVDNNDADNNNADNNIDNDDTGGNDADNNDTDDNSADNPVSSEPLGELNVLETINFRRQPSTDSEIIAKIERDTKLPYYEKHINEQGELWYQVLHEGISGYVTDSAVEIVQQEQTDEGGQPDNDAALSAANETLPSQEAAQDSNIETDLNTMTVSEASPDLTAENAPKKKLHIRFDLMAAACILGDILCAVMLALFFNKTYKLTRITKIGKKVKKQEKRNNAYRR